MSKKLIWILAGFMGVVMLGLIFVQAYWINNAVNIKEKQFEQLVMRSLSNIGHEVESIEAHLDIYDFISPGLKSDSFTGHNGYNFQYGSTQKFWHSENGSSLRIDEVFRFHGNRRNEELTMELQMDQDSLKVNVSPGLEKDNIQLNRPNEVIELPDPDLLEKKVKSKQELIDQVISNIFSPSLKIEERILPETLKELIDRELENQGIDIPYEFAVYRPDGNVAFTSGGYDPEKKYIAFTSRLFPNDFYGISNYLRVYFPDQRTFVLRSVGFMGLTSVIMTTIIIAIFIFTIWIIFRQKKLSEIKNDFVNNMTHELKTPISTISLASQMLSDDSIPVQNKNLSHISRIIDTESKRLGVQVEKVLQMAVFDKGFIKLKRKNKNFHEILDSSVNNFSLQVKKRGGDLQLITLADNSIVNVDEVHMTNVISNLLDNAMKYSDDTPEIKVKTRNNEKYLIVSIEDKGVGISKDDQKRIFDKFFRVHTGNVHNVKGFGLGLSYVKKIVDIHEGFINLKSELKKGTTFEIYLPLIT